LFTEAVAGNEEVDSFVQAKLKLRCFEIFKSFDRENQELLLDAMDELIEADGEVHPAELKLRNELVELFESDLGVELEEIEEEADDERVTIHDTAQLSSNGQAPPFFRDFEFHYSADPEVIRKQVEADRKLLDQTLDVLADQRAK